jgi:hypothetical protein
MNGGWNNKNESIPANIDKIISDARVNNCWVYLVSTKTFYTPDELETMWRHAYSAGNKTSNIKDFKIVTPMYAIRLATQWVNIANKKLQEIVEKSNNYNSEFRLKK